MAGKKDKEKDKQKVIRICVLGSSYCGKSALVNRFVNNSFEWIYEATTDPNIFRRLINITDDEEHKQYCMMQIEDLFPINHPLLQISDESNSNSLAKIYDMVLGNKRSEKKKQTEKSLFKETSIHGYMYVYDLTSKTSLDDVEEVIKYIHTREEKEAGKKKSGKAAKILVGTKSDCVVSIAPDFQNKIDALKKKYSLMVRKVSALTNNEIKEAFLDLARNALDSNVQDNERDSEDEVESGGFFGFLGCGSRDKKGGEEEEESRCSIS